MLQNANDWPRIAYADNPRPTYRNPPSPDDVQRIITYNWALGPIVTEDTTRIAAAIGRAHARNENAPISGQRCVLVTGRPLDGKTQGAAAFAMHESRQEWTAPPAGRNEHDLHAPWGYVEVEAGRGVAGVARSTAAFLGIPVAARASASVILTQLRYVMPQVGMRGLIVDDAHGIIGSSNAESRTFAGALKALITGLPVTLVVVGVRLDESALAGARGDEVRLRGEMVVCGDWPLPFRTRQKAPGPWERLVATLHHLLEIPGSDAKQGMASRSFVSLLATASDRRPGLAIEWVKAAAEWAVLQRRPLDNAALQATADYAHARITEAAQEAS